MTRYAPKRVPSEREIDVAFALEGVPGVVGVYALRTSAGEAHVLAVELRPFGGRSVAEAHYRLLNVLTYAECGRVLFVDADNRQPSAMSRATRISLTAPAREAAAQRAMGRVEAIAKRHEDERAEVEAMRSRAHEEPPSRDPFDLHRVHARAAEVLLALETLRPPFGVFVVEYMGNGSTRNMDVLVQLQMTASNVLAAHTKIVEGGTSSGRVLYGDVATRMRFSAQRVSLTTFDRIQARKRLEFRRQRGATVAAAPITRKIDRYLAARSRWALVLGHEDDADDVVVVPFFRRRLLVAHPDRAAAAALEGLADEVEVWRARTGWEALDLVHGMKLDLILSALRFEDMRGMQLYRAALAIDSELGNRFYFLASAHARDEAAPSASLARVLASPLAPEEVRRLLGLRL